MKTYIVEHFASLLLVKSLIKNNTCISVSSVLNISAQVPRMLTFGVGSSRLVGPTHSDCKHICSSPHFIQETNCFFISYQAQPAANLFI